MNYKLNENCTNWTGNNEVILHCCESGIYNYTEYETKQDAIKTVYNDVIDTIPQGDTYEVERADCERYAKESIHVLSKADIIELIDSKNRNESSKLDCYFDSLVKFGYILKYDIGYTLHFSYSDLDNYVHDCGTLEYDENFGDNLDNAMVFDSEQDAENFAKDFINKLTETNPQNWICNIYETEVIY